MRLRSAGAGERRNKMICKNSLERGFPFKVGNPLEVRPKYTDARRGISYLRSSNPLEVRPVRRLRTINAR